MTYALYGVAGLCLVALRFATNATLGFHIDELYYLACGRHPAFGYVDFPPIVPLLARLETGVLGVTPWALRMLPALVGGVNVILSAAFVRRLGGSLLLQALALLIALTIPIIAGTWLFQTVVFDQLTWMLALYWFLGLLVDGTPRYWILLGISLGIGLEVKFTIVALIVGVAFGVAVTPSLRRDLRTRYPWIAAGLILLIWAPNLVWQTVNGFPSLSYVLNHGGDIASGGGPASFAVDFLVLMFFVLPLWVAGLISLFRHPLLRAVGIACAIPIVIFLFIGKFYYPGPTIPIVLAQGLIALAAVERRRLRSGLGIAVVVACLLNFLVTASLALPTTPPNRLHSTGLDVKNTDFASTVGWPNITSEITSMYTALPPSERRTTVIIGSDYGIAGALDLYGDPRVLPEVMSPQLSDYFWLPAHLNATAALMVGYTPSNVSFMCTSATVVGHLVVPYQVVSLESDSPVTLCRLREPVASAWPGLRNFS